MTKPNLDALIAHYQAALRLRDWELTVSYAPNLTDHLGNAVWGLCSPCVDAKSATIILRDPETPPKGCTFEEACAQVEETVAHELSHLHFAPFGLSTPAEIAAEEQAVWALSGALVAAGRAPAPVSYRHVAATGSPARGASVARRGAGLARSRAAICEALGLPANASIATARAAIRAAAASSEENKLLNQIAKIVGAPHDASIVAVYQALASMLEGEPTADGASRAAIRSAKTKVASLLFGETPAGAPPVTDTKSILAEFKERFSLDGVDLDAPRGDESNDEVRASPGARIVRTRFGSIEISARELARVKARRKTVAEQEELLRTYAENKAGNERERGVRNAPRHASAGARAAAVNAPTGRTFKTRFGLITITAREIDNAKRRRRSPSEQEVLLQDYAENKAGDEHARGVRKG